jgi:hypothetical protein
MGYPRSSNKTITCDKTIVEVNEDEFEIDEFEDIEWKIMKTATKKTTPIRSK